MAINTTKTIMLEKQYLYIRASKGFYLEGVSTEEIWSQTGYYRFLTENVAKALGNSYVIVHYDSSDLDFHAECSDLFLEEIQNSVTVAVENIQSVLEDFADANHDDIETLSRNLGTALNLLAKDSSLGELPKISTALVGTQDGSATRNLFKALVGNFNNLPDGTSILDALMGGNTPNVNNSIFPMLKKFFEGVLGVNFLPSNNPSIHSLIRADFNGTSLYDISDFRSGGNVNSAKNVLSCAYVKSGSTVTFANYTSSH